MQDRHHSAGRVSFRQAVPLTRGRSAARVTRRAAGSAIESLERRLLLDAGDFSVRQIGQIGAGFSDVEVVGNRAYAAIGTGLAVLDVSNPAQMTQLSRLQLPSAGLAVAVSGSYAWVAAGAAGISVIDISDAVNPVVVATLDTLGMAQDIAIYGSYAYVAEGYAGLQVIDTTDASHPVIVGTTAIDGNVSTLNLADSRLYVSASSVNILSLEDPANPLGLGKISGSSTDVSVQGNTVYAAYGYSVEVHDIGDPGNPVQVGSAVFPYEVTSLEFQGNYLYAALGSSGVQAINFSDVSKPVSGTVVDLPGTTLALKASGTMLYAANGGAGVSALRLTAPAYPSVVGRLSLPPGSGQRVTMSGQFAYVAGGSSGLQIVNVSDPGRPVWMSTINVEAIDVAVIDSYAYITTPGLNGLSVWDVSNPGMPVQRTTVTNMYNARRIVTAGSYAFVSVLAQTRIIDVSTPSTPRVVNNIFSSPDAYAIAGNTLYSVQYGRFNAYNVANPMAFTQLFSVSIPGSLLDVAIRGSYAYITQGATGLTIVDISVPGAPQVLGTIKTAEPANEIAIAGNVAYIGSGTYGLSVYSLENPAAPTHIGTYDTVGSARTVRAEGALVYVADDMGGLAIFNASSPAAPRDISISSTLLPESPSGALVGLLTARDDNYGDTFTFTLASGDGDADNALFTISDNELRTAAATDYELGRRSYSVRIRAADQDGGWVEKAVAITVIDINEAPTDIALSKNTIAENNAIGDTVGYLTFTDPDAAASGTFSLVSGPGSTDNAKFTISSYRLKANASFNYEGKSTYSIRVRATDLAGLYCEKALTINVTDGPDVATPWVIDGSTWADAIGLVKVGLDYRLTLNGDVSYRAADLVSSITINGMPGNDSITIGGDTAATVNGGDGDDTLKGGNGSDLINGGIGNDSIIGMGGNDTINGEAGNDVVYSGAGADLIDLGDGNDVARSGRDGDTVRGGAGRDVIVGDNHDDLIYGGADNDTINGGSGNDTIHGDAGMDRLVGVGGNDVMHGGDDRDQIMGGYDNDTMYGEGGNDTLKGGLGNDSMTGGAGADTMLGEGGDDWLIASGDNARDLVRGDAGSDHVRRDALDKLLDSIEDNVLA